MKVQDVTCNGDADGSISTSVAGGTTDYTYLWDDASAQTTATAVGLSPGDYTVTVTDANGCTITTTPAVTITQPVVLSASATKVQDVTCNGDADGSISTSVAGGTTDYTYLWDDASAQTTATAVGLSPGDYTVTVTDANGCTITTTPAVTITQPVVLSASATKVQDVTCNGDADGSISTSVAGGTTDYTYLWDDASAQTTATAVGLSPGDYTVTVTDANGCTITTTPAVTITQPVVLSASATKVQDVTCNGDADGSISTSVAGGTTDYTYLWDDASAQTTATAVGLSPGDYTVTVTDANGCTITTTPAVTITQPVVLSASATKVQDVTCNGDADGSISTSVAGGTTDYTYLWDDASAQTTATAVGLSPGDYTVTVTDANGCTITTTPAVTITQPVVLSASATKVQDVTCNGDADGSISTSVAGGTTDYTYLWDDASAQTTATAVGLSPGDYTVTVTDANGCTITTTPAVTITQPVVLSASATKVQDVTCNGDADGSISTSVAGGTTDYTYLWDDASAQTTATAVGLSPGDYTVTVTDANGCTITTTPAVTITQPVVLSASATKVQDVTCNGDADGSISTSVAGGTTDYTYLWDDASAQTTATAVGLSPGDYTVTVTDANGCTITTTPAVTITQPVVLSASATKVQDVTCNGDADGSISTSVAGGTTDYTYLWDDASAQTTATAVGLSPGDYTVTVTDANGCTITTTPAVTITQPVVLSASATKVQDVTCNGDADGSISTSVAGGTTDYTYLWDDASAQTTATAVGLSPGDYTVTVTDANGCTITTTPAVTITQPVVLSASATKVQDVTCNGDADGSISTSVAGGTTDYTYLWDDASAQTTATAVGLSPGDYTVTVTDANGCTITTTPAVTITQPVVLSASATKVQDVTCNGDADGSISTSVAGGTTDYTYLWDDASAQTTATAVGLSPGDYTVTVTDANGCTITTTPAVTITQPVVLSASATKVQDVTCNGDADGSISTSVAGGTTDYTYLWDDASAQTTATAVGLSPGDYTVTVTDANGCTITTTPAVTITQPVVLSASATKVQDVTCNGDADGSISTVGSWRHNGLYVFMG